MSSGLTRYNDHMAKHSRSTLGQGEAVRQSIVEAANRLFYHGGYNATSFTDIAEAAGIPRGNFYYYYKSKDDILAAVIDTRIVKIRTMLAEWDTGEPDPRQRLKYFAQIIRRSEKEIIRYGCPMGSLNSELGKAQPALKAQVKKMFDLFIDWLTRQITMIGCAQAPHLALEMMGRTQGMAVMAHIYGDRHYLRAQLAELDVWIESLSN